MDKLDEVLVVSATDLVAHLACEHVTWLDRQAAQRTIDKPDRNDPMLELLRARGMNHELAYLARLQADEVVVVEIDDGKPLSGEPRPGRSPAERTAALLRREGDTRRAMADGADVVYQATFLDQRAAPWWRGHADFLRRVDEPSQLGAWSYEPEDTKLSRHISAGAVLQLCFYAEQLKRIQGVAPTDVHVVLGGSETVTVHLSEVAAYYRTVRRRFLESLDDAETYPLPTGHCAVCAWAGRCHGRWEADDHLSRVAFITRENVKHLEAAGITTLTALATSAVPLTVDGIRPAIAERLQTQARLQHASVPDEAPPFEYVLPIEAEMGLAALPEPDPGDLFYDIEGHPYATEGGLEYLHGIGWDDDGSFVFEPHWGHDPVHERRAFETLVDKIVERRRDHPDMHVYHYAPYETTAVGKLMGRYGTREDEVDDLLRGKVFVDLYRVVRQGVRVGVASYSIKKLEPLYMRRREGEIGSGGSSVVEYERWLNSGEQQILDEIEKYNRDDVESTWLLRGWLEARRGELVEAGTPISRPCVAEAPDAPLGDDLATLIGRLSGDREALLDEVDQNLDAVPDEARARWLMSDLLQWHRREDKPAWWKYFERRDRYDDADFIDDTETVGGLTLVGQVGTVKKSILWRYQFDPSQELKLRVGDKVLDPARLRRKELGEEIPAGAHVVFGLDLAAGTVDIKRVKSWEPPHPTALVPGTPIGTEAARASLRRAAAALLAHGIDDDGPARAARQLLARRPPGVAGYIPNAALRHADEDPLAAADRLVGGLRGSYLPVQGPPGAGKTYTAAEVILDRIASGGVDPAKVAVGVSAFTHSAIATLVREVIAHARADGRTLSIIQKIDKSQEIDDPFVQGMAKPADVAAAVADPDDHVDLVAGTSWLFARADMEGSVDTLFVDEAGQLSLANVIAVAPAARNLVLVGDPQQLAQPSKGTHPDGAGASALEHVLDGAATIVPARGLFLDQTWRMHPDICAFISEQVYDGRLQSRPEAGGSGLAPGPMVEGAGLRFLPVEHTANRTSSTEEADAVAQLYDALLGRVWLDHQGDQGAEVRLGQKDILVVAPYNAQVHALTTRLPPGARVGTVDKFQGQEAAVVLVSLAASSAEDVPRGMEFLYSRNRLNVAVSRAKSLCVLVASPQLLAVECRTVEQMRLANVLCRYVELATPVAPQVPTIIRPLKGTAP